MSLEDLYKEIILEHYSKPRNRGDLPGADVSIDLKNPTCGDEITLKLDFDQDRVADVRFQGKGCSISQASASMMTESIKGRSREQVLDVLRRVQGMMRGEISAEEADLGDLEALAGVRQFPVRIKCAMLAWEALSKGLDPSRAPGESPGSEADR